VLLWQINSAAAAATKKTALAPFNLAHPVFNICSGNNAASIIVKNWLVLKLTGRQSHGCKTANITLAELHVERLGYALRLSSEITQ